MDLSKLPLMPSTELPEAVPASPTPKVQSTSDWPVEDTLAGCTCASCERERELHRTRTAQPPTADPLVWCGSNPLPLVREPFDIGQALATVTGRMGWSTQIQNLPRNAPPVQESRRIRGRYSTYSQSTVYTRLHGEVRWREPGTLDVWDSSTGGRLRWTFSQEDADGSLRGNSMHWYPTEV